MFVQKYTAFSYLTEPTQLVDTNNHVWANYALAAYKGVHDYLRDHPAAHTATSRSNPGIKVRNPCGRRRVLTAGAASLLIVAMPLACVGCTRGRTRLPARSPCRAHVYAA